MGPYRTPAVPVPRPPAPLPERDREELIVHAAIAAVGAICLVAAFAEGDFGGGAALAVILLVVGVVGALRSR